MKPNQEVAKDEICADNSEMKAANEGIAAIDA